MATEFVIAMLVMGTIALSSVVGMCVFLRIALAHMAGERETTHEATLQALTWLKSTTTMEAVDAESRRERDAASLRVEVAAAQAAQETDGVQQTNATGIAYARNPRTGEEFDIVAGAGV